MSVSTMTGVLFITLLMAGYLISSVASDDYITVSSNGTTSEPISRSADTSVDPCRSITRRSYFLIGFIVPSLVLNVILIIVIVILLCCCCSIRRQEEEETSPEVQSNGVNGTADSKKETSVIIQFGSIRRGRSRTAK